MFISLKVDFDQYFLPLVGNLVTFDKFLGSGMKCDTSEPDSDKVYNELFSSFTTYLKTLCKPFPIIFANSYSNFHSI